MRLHLESIFSPLFLPELLLHGVGSIPLCGPGVLVGWARNKPPVCEEVSGVRLLSRTCTCMVLAIEKLCMELCFSSPKRLRLCLPLLTLSKEVRELNQFMHVCSCFNQFMHVCCCFNQFMHVRGHVVQLSKEAAVCLPCLAHSKEVRDSNQRTSIVSLWVLQYRVCWKRVLKLHMSGAQCCCLHHESQTEHLQELTNTHTNLGHSELQCTLRNSSPRRLVYQYYSTLQGGACTNA